MPVWTSSEADRLNWAVVIPLLASALLLQLLVPLLRLVAIYEGVEQGLSPLAIGALSAVFAIFPVAFIIQVGRYNDRHGESWIAVVGAVLMVLTSGGMLVSGGQFWLLLGLMALLGLGQVMLLSALQMVTTKASAPHRQDTVLGYMLVALAAGQMLAPLAISLTTPAGQLYPDAIIVWIALLAAAVLVVTVVAMCMRLPAHSPVSEDRPFSIIAILRQPGLTAIILAAGFCVAAADLMTAYFPLVAATRQIDAAMVGLLLSARAMSSAASRVVFDRLAGLLGRRKLLLLTMACAAVTTFLLVFDLPLWALGLILALGGFCTGLAIALSISLTLSLAPQSARATAMSMRLTAARLGQFTVPLAAGLLAMVLGVASIFAVLGVSLLACTEAIRRQVAAR